MKKTIIFILLLVAVIIAVIVINISNNKIKTAEVANFNKQFEKYKDETLYGADILSIINKAIDNNEEYKVPRDEKGNYKADNIYSVKVELTLLTKDDEGNLKEVVHPMEALEKAGLDGFISSFSLTAFKCEKIEYNEVHRVSKIIVKQMEE